MSGYVMGEADKTSANQGAIVRIKEIRRAKPPAPEPLEDNPLYMAGYRAGVEMLAALLASDAETDEDVKWVDYHAARLLSPSSPPPWTRRRRGNDNLRRGLR